MNFFYQLNVPYITPAQVHHFCFIIRHVFSILMLKTDQDYV